MTPQLRQLVGQQARALQLQLNERAIEPVAAAEAARRIFTDAADPVRTRWLNLELNGYGDLVDVRPLHVVLDVPANDRLAVHVTAYRTQRGRTIQADGAPVEFRHFFVEALPDLAKTGVAVATSSGSSLLELEFVPHPSAAWHPMSGSFSRDVFDRVIGGFVAALHLQLGTLA